MRSCLATLARIELKLFLRNPSAAFFTLVFPLLILFVFGAVFGNRPITGQPGGMMDVSVPGYMAMIIGSMGLMGIPGWIAGYREQGVFRRLRLTPIGPARLLAAQGIVGLLAALTGGLLLFVAGKLVFHLRTPLAPVSMIGAFILGSAGMFCLGAMVAAVARTARTAQAVGMALYFPMLFLSGAAFPRMLMPPGVRRASDFLPLTHVGELISSLWLRGEWRPVSVLVLAGVVLVAGGIAVHNFRWE